MTLFAGAVAFAVPFAAFTGLLLYQFYDKGSFLSDAGWFAFVVAARDLRLSDPAALGGASFFTVHISPIFVATGFLRRAFAVSDAQYFAGFIGLCHALPALAVFWALRAGWRLSGVGCAVAALIGIAFAFNGTTLAIARYPHVEILIVGSAGLFAVALVRRRLVIASLCLAVALATREDAGFHLFALLSLTAALNRWHGIAWRAQRPELTFAAVALGYAGAACALQLTIATGPSALARIYLGHPAFTHLTAGLVVQRLLGYAVYRAYLLLPAMIAVIWAVRTRNLYVLIGYAAFVPWGLLQLTARSDIAGTLSGYYAYPFLIASFWPLVGVLLDCRRRGEPPPTARFPVLAFTAMIAASFVGIDRQYNPGQFDLAEGFFNPPALTRQARTEQALSRLIRSKPLLGAVLADGSVVALAPNDFAWSETVLGRTADRPDAVVFFAHGYEAATARRIAAASGLDRYYQVPGTPLRLVSARPVPPEAPIAAFLALAEPPD